MKHSVVKYIYQMFQIFPQTKGELHPERKEAFEKAQKAYEKLLANTSSLAVSIFDHNMPDVFFFFLYWHKQQCRPLYLCAYLT